MGKKLFVGNLSFDTSSADLEALFSQAGSCESATVLTDRATGRSRGFGFVEMGSDEEAQRAITELNGTDLGGRTINVSEARERTERRFDRSFGPPQGFSHDFSPADPPFRKDGGSRRGLRGKKR